MKECPKCGAGMNEWKHGWLCSNPHCCHDIVDEKITKKFIRKYELKHQQRLDKILSKFEVEYKGTWLIFKRDGVVITYGIKSNQFYIFGNVKISIKTVESILKDLKEE